MPPEGWSEGPFPNRIAKEIEMTLEQLRIFIAVAERQHVTRAAQALNLAQSAASHAIRRWGRATTRSSSTGSSRSIELTKAGQAFLTEARASICVARTAVAGRLLSSSRATRIQARRRRHSRCDSSRRVVRPVLRLSPIAEQLKREGLVVNSKPVRRFCPSPSEQGLEKLKTARASDWLKLAWIWDRRHIRVTRVKVELKVSS